jgi:hypothetical protein
VSRDQWLAGLSLELCRTRWCARIVHRLRVRLACVRPICI